MSSSLSARNSTSRAPSSCARRRPSRSPSYSATLLVCSPRDRPRAVLLFSSEPCSASASRSCAGVTTAIAPLLRLRCGGLRSLGRCVDEAVAARTDLDLFGGAQVVRHLRRDVHLAALAG